MASSLAMYFSVEQIKIYFYYKLNIYIHILCVSLICLKLTLVPEDRKSKFTTLRTISVHRAILFLWCSQIYRK